MRDANGQRAASTELADRDRNRASKGADVREFFWWIDQHRNIAAQSSIKHQLDYEDAEGDQPKSGARDSSSKAEQQVCHSTRR